LELNVLYVNLICDVNYCAWAAKLRYGRIRVNDVSVALAQYCIS